MRGVGVEVLVSGAITDVENDAPNEVGGESAPENDYENREILPKGTTARGL
jgi:hypothetical protein